MDLFEGISQALQSMWTWGVLLAFLFGCVNGIIFGVLPGLSGSVGIALMIPFTYNMNSTEAMALFVAALASQTFSGSVTAILLNTPGTSPNAATTFDGYPLARQGRGGFAIGISATSSVLGAIIGLIVLIAVFPVMRSVILAFSFPEFAMLGVLGLAAIAVAARGSMLKGLIAGMIGLLISFIGFAPIGGDIRFVFGQTSLYDGIGIVPVLIGLFAVSEALRLISSNQSVAKDVSQLAYGRGQVWEGVVYTFKQPGLVLRSSIVGTLIGIVPAVGGTLASFLAYFQAAKTVKNPNFGGGDPRGVVAPEAANNAKDAGSALPSLAFGIPGSADWAIILGAMIIHGVTPGPNLIRDNPDVVWVAIIVIFLAAFVASGIGVFTAPSLMQVTRIRPSLLAPIVVVLAIVGAFGLNLQMIDVLFAVGFGLLGYTMKLIGMPIIPLILGLILGPIVERAYLQTLTTFGGLSGFVTRPISLTLVLLTVGIVAYEIYAARRSRKQNPRGVDEGVASAIRPLSLAVIAGVGLIAVAALALAQGFGEQSRIFPIITGSLLVALTAAYLLIALTPALRRRFGAAIADGGGMEDMQSRLPEDEPETDEARGGAGPATSAAPATATATVTQVGEASDERASRSRLIKSVLLLLAFAGVTPLVGLAITVPTVLVLFFRLVGRESWRLTGVLTVATVALLYFAFVSLLGVPLEGGALLSY